MKEYKKTYTFTCKVCSQHKEAKLIGRCNRQVCDDCKNLTVTCACGCGQHREISVAVFTGQKSFYLPGHNSYDRTPEVQAKISEGIKRSRREHPEKYILSEESKKKISDAIAVKHQKGDYIGAYGQIVSQVERALIPYFEPLGYIHSTVKKYHITCPDRTRIPDFVLSGERKIIETWGTWYHRDIPMPEGKCHETEEFVISKYQESGWSCMILWIDYVHEIPKLLPPFLIKLGTSVSNSGGF